MLRLGQKAPSKGEKLFTGTGMTHIHNEGAHTIFNGLKPAEHYSPSGEPSLLGIQLALNALQRSEPVTMLQTGNHSSLYKSEKCVKGTLAG